MSQKQVKRERKRNLSSTLPKDIPAPNNGAPLEQKVTTNANLYFKVPGPLAQLLLDYIQTKPYNEVHQLIGGLMRCEKVKE